MKVCLIHGYCTHLATPIWRRHPYPHLCFKWINQLIKDNKIGLYIRGINKKISRSEFINPYTFFNHYKSEQTITRNKYQQEKLYNYLKNNNIECAISHSMWSYLLLNTINNFWIPEKLKKIITIQWDSPINYEISESIKNRCENNQLLRENYYCPWDPALILSSLVNLESRIWLLGMKKSFIKNKFYPLKWQLNLHTATINDKEFFEKILQTGTWTLK